MATYSMPNTIQVLPESLKMLTLFGIGAVILRSSGCIINDLHDSDIDKKVERTKMRPIASGEVSKTEALILLGAQLSAGFLILLQLNVTSIVLGASSLFLVGTYPLAKRYTNFPQVVLGATFNWGALLGWTAMTSVEPSVMLPLYVSGIIWSVVYDTIYAFQDIKDDIKVGVKSTAITFSKAKEGPPNYNRAKNILYSLTTVVGGLWMYTGYLNDHSLLFQLGTLLAYTDMMNIVKKRPGWILSSGILADILFKCM